MKRLWKILAIFFILLLLAAAGLQWYVSRRFTPDALVLEIERGRNCRAEISSSSVSLFSFPARVEIAGLRLLPADSQSLENRPLSERKLPKESDTFIAVPRAVLEVNLWSLLSRHVAVKDFVMENAEVSMVRKKKGENTLATLLGPRLKKADDGTKKPEAPEEKSAEPAAPGTPFTSSLDTARITGATVRIRNEKKKQNLVFENVSISLDNLHLIPGGDSAQADVKITLLLLMDEIETQRRQLDFPITLEGHQLSFDPATGAFADGATVDLTLKKDAYIDRIPTLEKLGKKLAKLKDQIGLDLTKLPPSGRLQRDITIRTSVKDSILRFEDDANFYFDTYRIKIKKDSWLSLEDQSHNFDGILTANDDITRDAVAGVDEFLKAKDAKLAAIAKDTIIDQLLNNKDHPEKPRQLAIPFISTEDIGKPEVELTKSFERDLAKALAGALKDILKDAISGGDSLENLLDGLLKKDDEK